MLIYRALCGFCLAVSSSGSIVACPCKSYLFIFFFKEKYLIYIIYICHEDTPDTTTFCGLWTNGPKITWRLQKPRGQAMEAASWSLGTDIFFLKVGLMLEGSLKGVSMFLWLNFDVSTSLCINLEYITRSNNFMFACEECPRSPVDLSMFLQCCQSPS